KVTGKIAFGQHEMVEDFKFLADLVEKHGDGSQFAKYTIPAPTMFFQRVISDKEKEIYPDINDLARDLIKVYQDAIQAFYDAGCKYLQFDECVLSALDDDRKSTRLNSSHVSISYAVFCLKKKKMKDSDYI